MDKPLSAKSRPGGLAAAYAGPMMGLRLTMSRSPWRIGPGWSVLAGALAAGVVLTDAGALMRLFAAVLLAELAWGAFWQLGLTTRPDDEPSAGRGMLPYMQRGAPATRLAGALAGDVSTAGPVATWYGLGTGLVLATVLSVLLGREALILTGCALGIGVIGWVAAQRGSAAALPLAILGVGLPWLLGMSLANGAALTLFFDNRGPVLMAAAFTILQWGAVRAWLSDARRPRLLWLGQAGVLVCAVMLHVPWLTGILGGLFLAPTLRLTRFGQKPDAVWGVSSDCAPWWLGGMFVAALALRF